MDAGVVCDVPWNKSGLSSSYSGSSSSYASGKTSDSGLSSSTSTSQYDGGGGYARRLSAGGGSTGTSSNSYLSGSSYRSPYLGSSYSRGSTSSYLSNSGTDSAKDNADRSISRSTTSSTSTAERRDRSTSRSGASTLTSERRDSKEGERLSLRDKYTTGTYAGRGTDTSLRTSYSTRDKEEPDTTSSYRALGRSISNKSNKDVSPEPTSTTTDSAVKNDRVGYSSSLSPYRLYSRSSYSRSTSRDSAPENSSTSPATTPVHTPTSLRFGSSSRYGSNLIRSPVSEKPPSVFGLSSLSYNSRSMGKSNSLQDTQQDETTPNISTTSSKTTAETSASNKDIKETVEAKEEEESEEEIITQTTFITVVTRGTSPTPPSSSSYIRTRRSDLARVIEKTIAKPKTRPEMVDKEIQSDRGDDTARLSRYGVSSRWSYLDRYPSATSSYSRYSSRYNYTPSSKIESSKSDDKDTSSKTSSSQDSSQCKSSSLNSSKSSTSSLTKEDNKNTSTPIDKVQPSISKINEKVSDNNINSIKKLADQLQKVVDKQSENTISIVNKGDSPSVSKLCNENLSEKVSTKTKTVAEDNTENEIKIPVKNEDVTQEKGSVLKKVKSVKRVNSKSNVNDSDISGIAKSIESKSISSSETGDKISSEILQKKDGSSEDVKNSTSKDIKSVKYIGAKSSNLKKSDEIETSGGMKSKCSSAASLSSEGLSEKSSLIDESKMSSQKNKEATCLSRVQSFKNLLEKNQSHSGATTPLGTKSKCSSTASLSSEEVSDRTSSIDVSLPKDTSESATQATGLTRIKSIKSSKSPLVLNSTQGNETPVGLKSKTASSASLCSEGAPDNTSSIEGMLSKMPSEEASPANTPSKEASLSKTSSNEGPLTNISHISKSVGDSLASKLPPPIPKNDNSGQGLKTSSSSHSLNKFSAANKDFRKSALNVEIQNAQQAEAFKQLQEKQRKASTLDRKFKRSVSASSGDSDPSCTESGSALSSHVAKENTQGTTPNSLNKLHTSSSTSMLPPSITISKANLSKVKSLVKVTSNLDNDKNIQESPHSPKCAESSESSTESSSSETSSSESSSSEDEDGGLTMKRLGPISIRRRPRRTPSSENVNTSKETPNEKNPDPPVSPKPQKSESFLMRALAPVTNLFRSKQENSSSENVSEGLQKAGSTQSLNKSDQDESLKQKSDGDKSCSNNTEAGSTSNKIKKTRSKVKVLEEGNENNKIGLKFKLRKQESGERAWWLDSNPNIPEGIKRMDSNTSINKIKDIAADNSKINGVQKISSKQPVNLEEPQDKNDESSLVSKKKICVASEHDDDQSPENMNGVESSISINIDNDIEMNIRNYDKSVGVQKTSSNSSLSKGKDTDPDSAKPPIGGDKVKRKIYKIKHQQSGDIPWLDNNAPIPEGVKKSDSNASMHNLNDSDVEKTTSNSSNSKEVNNLLSSDEIKKSASNVSINKDKDSDPDVGKPPVGGDKAKRKLHRIRHQPSGEMPWWLDNSSSVPEGVQRIKSNSSINKIHESDTESRKSDINDLKTENTSGVQKTASNSSLLGKESDPDVGKPPTGESKAKRKIYRIKHQQSGDIPWWLDNNQATPEGVQRNQSSSSVNKLQDSDTESRKSDGVQRMGSNSSVNKLQDSDSENKCVGLERVQSNHSVNKLQSSDSDSKKNEGEKVRKKNYRISHHKSGDLPWWQLENNQNEGVKKVPSNHSVNKIQESEQKEDDSNTRSFPYRLRKQESGEKAWWLSSRGDVPEGVVRLDSNQSLSEYLKTGEIKESKKGSSSSESSDEESEMEKNKDTGSSVPKFPLVLPNSSDNTSKSKEESGRVSPYDNLEDQEQKTNNKNHSIRSRPKNAPLFIGSHTNIDDILGTAATLVNPVMGVSRLRKKHGSKDADSSNEEDSGGEFSELEEVDPGQVRIHDSTAQKPEIQHLGDGYEETRRRRSSGMIKLDDTALQLYKDGDYGSYLDLEASISEQQEEFDGFQTNRKNSIVLRTQLSVRVHTIIEKLLNSEGRELRRALFSLKQIFQEDKDLVHEFVQNDGLACLIKVGSEADQNYQNYILRALGQVMLYVDGMNGVMEHNETVQWLYALIASKFRLVVKTALKLLLVFVEYVETNCLLLIKAVHAVDTAHGLLPWSNIVKLLKDYDAADTELLIYAMTLVNKTLNGIPDQDTYYDQVDALEEQGIEGTIQRYMSKQGTDLDLLRQFQIYEAVLHHEDGEEKGTPLKQLDETVRKTLRNRKSLTESLTAERRKSRRHSTGTSPMSSSLGGSMRINNSLQNSKVADDDESESSSSRSSPGPELNGSYKESKAGDAGVTPALRRRRERAERQRSFIREQQETAATLKATLGSPDEGGADENVRLCQRLGNGTLDNGDTRSNKLQNRTSSRKDLTPLLNAVNKLQDTAPGSESPEGNGILKNPWVLSMMYGKSSAEEGGEESQIGGENEQDESGTNSERKKILQLKRENTVKDLTQKLANQNIIHSPVDDGSKNINRIGDMTGLISKAKEGLAKSKSKQDVVKSPTNESIPKMAEVKKSETELHWEELVHSMKRPLSLCDLDFTDLGSEDEVDILSPTNITNGGPPPPPPVPMAPGMNLPRGIGTAPPPPPPASRFGSVAPPPMPPTVISPPFGVSLRSQRGSYGSSSVSEINKSPPPAPVKKTKKTVKLFWKEVRDDPIILAKLQRTGMIWDELNPVCVDTQKLEHLFESRAKDLITKEKQQEMNKNKEIIVLDHKRSNAINIGMTKLPPPRSIKTAILKMDATIMNREGIEKLLTMLPTEEERSKIQEAQVANPEMPLGSAEQFLLTLASISELPARLKLWAFKLDFENSEKEIAEPLMDLKQGMETLKSNKTFRGILSTLLSIGIFLNGSEVKGFQIEYLAKVPEVKDTVHKHSLLHHLCHMVMEKFPDASDLYSEIGAVTRASKVDFDELSANIVKMEQECKASWDHLKVIAKHDGSTMKVKMSDFLADCAERIIVLSIVHRRVMNRFHKFLLWLGIPLHRVTDTKPNEFCRVVSEFSLEYRTTRERVLQQLEKKANHRERNKTRGKMITEVGKFRTKEDRADAELRQLLGSDLSDAESIHGTFTLPWRRQRKDLGRTVLGPLTREETVNGNITDGDDEILESLVKTATKAPTTRTTPRERKRTRHADRKSLKRSRTRENNPVEGGRESP